MEQSFRVGQRNIVEKEVRMFAVKIKAYAIACALLLPTVSAPAGPFQTGGNPRIILLNEFAFLRGLDQRSRVAEESTGRLHEYRKC